MSLLSRLRACHVKSIFADHLQTSHACHPFCNCYNTLTFYSLSAGCRILCACQTKRRFNVQKWRKHVVSLAFWLGNVLRATTACTFSTSPLPQVFRERCVLYILTSKYALRHNSVHFWNISTSKWSENRVLCAFWLRHVLRATTACTFSASTFKSAPTMTCFVHFDCAILHLSSPQMAPHPPL